jgi:hypothetical protein
MKTDEGGVWVGSWELIPTYDVITVVAHGEGMSEGKRLALELGRLILCFLLSLHSHYSREAG